jgi:hypothetical protein
MADVLPFGGREYCLLLSVMLLGRGADFLSTWVATPTLLLEANPLAKKLGWRWGSVVNIALCVGFAFFVLPAIIIATCSALVAAHNFQRAWLMRTMGETNYRDWYVERVSETRPTLYLFCLFGETVLTAALGGLLLYFSELAIIPFGIGMGIVAYAGAVTFYTLLALWRLRRADRWKTL